VPRLQSHRGDAAAAFASAPVKLDETYVTPAETHNPLELHSTTAMWDGEMLTLYDSTQGVINLRSVLAQMFGLPKENVRVIAKFLGSGFGGKLSMDRPAGYRVGGQTNQTVVRR
jgi:xanthine dehydrogenase YagR molybdenum-binding subunit